MRFLASCLLMVLLQVSPVSGKVNYELAITEPAHHLAQVSATFPVEKRRQITVQMPAWRTGKYKILDLANGVRHFSAQDQTGNPLPWQKVDKSSWQIQLNDTVSAVSVSYELYANLLGDRVRHIDDSHAYLDASGVFVYAEELRSEPIEVRLSVPDEWQSRSGMAAGPVPHSFVAANYDVLVDSPIETGIHHFREFEADGRTYQLLVWGEGNYDLDQMVKDLAQLSSVAEDVWGGYPFKRYLYMVHATSGESGATEHMNSTVIQKTRFSFAPREDYLKFINTASHEFVHTWNVKAYRPSGIQPYDYQKENYSHLFWVAEGSTSYYDGLLLARAEVITLKEFLENWAKSIGNYQQRPGRLHMPLSQASFDTWIEGGGDRGHNAGVSIYQKGSLVSWLLDFEIRKRTNNKKSYDDVHRLLYERFPATETGYTVADFKNLLKEVAGSDFEQFWRGYVDGMQELPIEQALAQVGLKLDYKLADSEDAPQKPWLGFKVDDELKVTQVDRDSPAWMAGLTAGDHLVALNGIQVRSDELDDRIEELEVDEKISLHFFRRHQLHQVTAIPVAQPNGKLRIVAVDKPSRSQRRAFKAWTGLDLSRLTEK